MNEVKTAVAGFLETWTESPEGNRQGFVRLTDLLFGKEGVLLDFQARPGVTYSFRASVSGHSRPLFVMVDVIEDQPRWLSVCFFGDMVQDPEEKGALSPAVCWEKMPSVLILRSAPRRRSAMSWRGSKKPGAPPPTTDTDGEFPV